MDDLIDDVWLHAIEAHDDYARRAAAIGIEQTYRDDAHVVGEVRSLAAQLHAVADGARGSQRVVSPPPPFAGRQVVKVARGRWHRS